MRNRFLVVVGAVLSAAMLAAPARGWQVSAEDHAKHHPEAQAAAPKTAPPVTAVASGEKLDQLVKKMNAAQGQAKVDAIAELLTVLVQTHQGMHANMQDMMQHMGGTHSK